MSKGFIISISLLLVCICVDLISLRPKPKEESFKLLETYVDSELSHYKNLLSSEQYINLFQKDSLNTEDLSKIKELEDQLESDHIFARVYNGSKLLYWKQGSSEESFCDIRKANDSTVIHICLEVYDKSGELYRLIYDRSGVNNRIFSSEDELSLIHI